MKKIVLVLLIIVVCLACKSEDDSQPSLPQFYSILSLGDSYTIGQSVCETCGYPEQLKDSLMTRFPVQDSFSLQVIAQTGWPTSSLLNAIDNENLDNNYDIVTLLIGVNNQFQGYPFSIYETEFPELVTKAITLAKNDPNNVIVISIPDYLYTTYGELFGDESISTEIDEYNDFAENYCTQNGITFVNITDITRQGLDYLELISSDGLHPSELAYSLFVERLLPVAIDKIQ